MRKIHKTGVMLCLTFFKKTIALVLHFLIWLKIHNAHIALCLDSLKQNVLIVFSFT